MFLKDWLKRRKSRKRPSPPEHVGASVHLLPDGYEVAFGAQSFFVKIGRAPDPDTPTFDFAVFGLAALSMSNNLAITLDAPVSASAAAQVKRIREAFDLWSFPRLAPLRLRLSTVVSDPDRAPRPAVGLCLSGGVDSTAAAIEALNGHGLTHGMLIAGADYPDRDHSGFVELHRRVARQADMLGIELLVTETDIRTCGFQWEMLFSFNLAMCLHANSDLLGTGAIGADYTEIQDLTMHPWGTSHAMSGLFATENMRLLSLNRTLGRTEKVREISTRRPELIPEISLCWFDTSTGGNCGRCLKCQRTKLNFLAANGEIPDIFIENPPVENILHSLSVPARFEDVKMEFIQYSNICGNLDEGDLKTALGKHLEALRAAYLAGPA